MDKFISRRKARSDGDEESQEFFQMLLEDLALRSMRRKYTDEGFEDIFQTLEGLRMAMARNQLNAITRMPCGRICEWLDSIADVASDLKLVLQNQDNPKFAPLVEQLLRDK